MLFRSVACRDLTWEDCQAQPLESLGGLPLESIRLRFAMLKFLNELVTGLIPLVDMQYVNEDWSLAFMLGAIRRLVFIDVKLDLFEEVLCATHTQRTSPIITLNRQVAQEARVNSNMFLQGFKQLSQVDPALLRQPERAWAVKLLREGAMDVGGPYREAISEFCSDLLSPALGLFIRCPNASSEIGFNQDKFIPNPSASSLQQLAQFEFVGQLIGISLRTKNTLDLSLPSIIWKPLVATKLEWSDLEGVDQSCCKFLEAVRDLHHTGVTAESFYDLIFETFTTRSSDGRIVELKPGGASCQVTWENRALFTVLVENYRLHEFRLQTEAIARGIQTIFPSSLLCYLSWQQLEHRVCGDPDFDIDLLKRHTRYVGVAPTDSHIVIFWEVLSSFSPREKALFIRFVWGRSQLPREGEFTTPFQLQAFPVGSSSVDELLPMAHTCFFSVSLPAYTSSPIMRARLLYAITSCREIDSDFVVPDGESSLQEDSDNEDL